MKFIKRSGCYIRFPTFATTMIRPTTTMIITTAIRLIRLIVTSQNHIVSTQSSKTDRRFESRGSWHARHGHRDLLLHTACYFSTQLRLFAYKA